MTVSALRTIVLPAQRSGYGAPVPPALVWPMAQPGALLDYSLDATALLSDVDDEALTVAVATRPSGSGELQAQTLDVVGDMITVWLGGGVAGRNYAVRVTLQTQGGRSFVWVASLPLAFDLARLPLPAPPDCGFGPSLNWAYVPALDYSVPGNSMYLPLIA